MEYIIKHNEQFNSLEITFSGKPSEAVRDALKALKFRWHGVKKLWYGYSSEDAARAAIEGQSAKSSGTKPGTVKAATQDHIRIYYNGIKIDGGKLIRCFYSLDNDCAVNGECVSISARDYSDLPRDLLPVTNDTDIYTDYFDSDRATLTPDHPLYRYFRFAALKARAKDSERYCAKIQKDLDAGKGNEWRGRREYLESEIKAHRAYIDAYNAETDPGQPTAEDLQAIDSRRQEAENARRAAEHEEQLKQREIMLNLRADGRQMIERTAETYPIKDGEPVVTINWSEHPAFCAYDDDALKLSVAAADSILHALDMKQHNTRETENGVGWYFKTKFTITGTDPDGDPIDYHGRFDIGDGEGGLIQHIRNLGEWERTHEEFGKEKDQPDETNDLLQFAEYLETFLDIDDITDDANEIMFHVFHEIG